MVHFIERLYEIPLGDDRVFLRDLRSEKSYCTEVFENHRIYRYRDKSGPCVLEDGQRTVPHGYRSEQSRLSIADCLEVRRLYFE